MFCDVCDVWGRNKITKPKPNNQVNEPNKQPNQPITDLVDDIEESGDIFLILAARVVLLRPHAPAVTVPPRPLLLAGDGGTAQPVAGQVGCDPSQGASPPRGKATQNM